MLTLVSITDLRDRMEVYHQMRNVKSTMQMEERVGTLSKSSFRGYEPLDAAGLTANSAVNTLPPLSFSPPPVVRTESTGSESRQTGVAQGVDVPMLLMDDIDWVSNALDGLKLHN